MAISITPLSPHTGAEVRGIDLRGPVSDAVRQQLNDAFSRHSVLVIRDQELAADQFVRASELFGEVFRQHDTRFALPENPLVHYISNQDKYPDGKRYIPGEGYHTDHSNDRQPPKATVLHAIKLPDRGGDTHYANMQLAYEKLPERMKQRLEGLKAVHVYQIRHSTRKLMGMNDALKQHVPPAVEHPIVRTHPETGRKAIYINPIRIDGIVGMSEKDALALLAELLEHATRPDFEYRHRWRVGDMVLWDNRCLLHKANGDYDMSQVRYLYRVMLKDEVAAEQTRLRA